jgi:hypothetical protein
MLEHQLKRFLGRPFAEIGQERDVAAEQRLQRAAQAKRLSALVTLDEIVQFIEPEFAQLHDGRLAAIDGRQDISGLVLAVHVHHDPCLVYAVMTTEISVRQEM